MEFCIEIIDLYSIIIKILKVKILCKMYVIALFNKENVYKLLNLEPFMLYCKQDRESCNISRKKYVTIEK